MSVDHFPGESDSIRFEIKDGKGEWTQVISFACFEHEGSKILGLYLNFIEPEGKFTRKISWLSSNDNRIDNVSGGSLIL